MPVPTSSHPRPLLRQGAASAAVLALALGTVGVLPGSAAAAPVVGSPVAGPAADGTSARSDARLAAKLSGILDDARSRTESDVSVLDADTGQVLYARRASSAGMPASNAKILTAVAALHELGPGYRFSTDVVRRGKVRDGVLHGNLYLVGHGDPTTRQSDYAGLAEDVRAAGITAVTGKVVADGSFFDDKRYNPGWSTSYASASYAAQTAALTVAPDADLDSGTVLVKVKGGSRGKRPTLSTTPGAAKKYLELVNQASTTGSTSVSLGRGLGGNTVTVRGHVRAGTTWSGLVTVDKPELYAAAVFRRELSRQDVEVEGGTKLGTTPATKRTRVARDRSVPLAELLVPFLKLSNNLHAEALTKTMGTLDGRPGSWPGGLARTTAYVRGLGVPTKGLSLTDGSGVARRDRVSPLTLTSVLVTVREEPWWPAFDAGLPVAGVNSHWVGGTLRHRMNGTRAADNAHAKTGSLTGVTALSGYVTGRDGRHYAFSMVSNYAGATPRPVENELVVALAGWRG
ncbi:D-alanyl-D-alanine carboxypeptidase/D-alanyl-D-alanine endopeptidase [Microlunatus flavus]|uniref:D-alanyl-D-alanine carboxypeptidase / D-alanyl-D-alanine-endopeptidase (Penicillin-binding protein 4) n=1 Tax=Microlunatus flavus TaxID=1036181 RepID=A0A1H9KF72_9ACTN|nr:D-alanyl-D-alanine carboxypeptidase/D-alanyl-D-alanine-endopeptidase [Microlunatus flavus]SEQ97804.1 D-alanyl-D-alanine carboxypeptidase / D-alanyl-D-alanine-endopeptidase (penicillin-binding protein 4) [Microlunatus flavus]